MDDIPTSTKRLRKSDSETFDKQDTNPEEVYGFKLWTPTFYKCPVKISRKQHLTITQYKPGDSTESYAATVLPISIFDFWVQENSQYWNRPFHYMSSIFPYCNFISAHIRISNFIPMQRSLQATTTLDTTSFNISPYLYISEDTDGYITQVPTINDITINNWIGQNAKIPSAYYWTTENDPGLLMTNNVRTLSAGEIYSKTFTFNKHERFFVQTPKFDSSGYWLMPGDYIANSNYIPFWKKNITSDQLNSYGIYQKTLPAIFLFMPYIESATNSEDVVRMMGHVLLETELILELYSDRDGYPIYAKQGSPLGNNSVPLDFIQYNVNVKSINFSNFRK